jgi:hypothetical protein
MGDVGNGADQFTESAAGTLGNIDIAGMLHHRCGEITGIAFKGFHFGVGEQLNISVPPHFDQFGRDDAHGTVIGGKGLVELCHFAADGG